MAHAVICGSYINAFSLAESLRAIDWEGRIVCLKDHGNGPVLMDLCVPGVEIWETSLEKPQDLVTLLCERLPADDFKVVFFTDERFLEAFREEARFPRLRSVRFFVGSMEHLDTILDRCAFYRFIEEYGLGEVPRTLPGGADPWEAFPKEFFLRFRRSWDGLRKLPRIRLVSDRRRFEESIAALRRQGYTEADWCYQEVLSVSARHNVSICGWHDREARLHVATRKVLQHPPKTGNGDVCEVIDAPPGLEETTERLLEALDYSGPFELEFVLDTKSGSYKIIELNPRFWMQHGLVGAWTGEELVRRYLGRSAATRPSTRPPRYWINTIYALSRLLRADLRVLYYLGSGSVRVPAWGTAVRWLPRLAPQLWRRLVHRGQTP
jgi:hypothetical protein